MVEKPSYNVEWEKRYMIYHSKKDWWLVALVWVAVLLPFAIGVYHLVAESGNAHAGWTALYTGAFTAGMVLLLTYPLYYEIRDSRLIVRCGVLVRKQIPLSSIIEARLTRNPASAPAWSLDRLHIDYRRDGVESVLISPGDRLQFMRELAGTGTGLEMRGERLVRIRE